MQTLPNREQGHLKQTAVLAASPHHQCAIEEVNSVKTAKVPPPCFSYFRGPITNVRPVADGPVQLDGLWQIIRGRTRDGEPAGYTRLQLQIEALRAAPVAKQDQLKRQLDYVTPAGIFTPKRANANFRQPSGLLVLDFDDVVDIAGARACLLTDLLLGPEVALLFTSPSGTGLKVFLRLDPSYDYAENFDSVAAYLRHCYPTLQLSLDTKCREVSRACFLSFDPNAYLHPDYC